VSHTLAALIASYALIGMAIGRVTAGIILYDEAPNDIPNGKDKLWAFVTLVVSIAIWPAIFIGWAWKHKAEAFVITPTEVTKRRADEDKRRLAELAERTESETGLEVALRDDDKDDSAVGYQRWHDYGDNPIDPNPQSWRNH
jgi:hypothetical protein